MDFTMLLTGLRYLRIFLNLLARGGENFTLSVVASSGISKILKDTTHKLSKIIEEIPNDDSLVGRSSNS